MRSYIDVKDCIKLGARSMPAAIAKINGKEYNIQFTKQKTGYGEKLFLVCPKCGSRRTKLYLYGDGLLCREVAIRCQFMTGLRICIHWQL